MCRLCETGSGGESQHENLLGERVGSMIVRLLPFKLKVFRMASQFVRCLLRFERCVKKLVPDFLEKPKK